VARARCGFRALAKACDAEPLSSEQTESRRFDVLIHATPLGMSPRADQCFFHGHVPAKLVFDMVYNPLDTALIRKAKDQGAEVICGLEMFLEQAARQFEIWTGENAPRAVMEKAAMKALLPGQGSDSGWAPAAASRSAGGWSAPRRSACLARRPASTQSRRGAL